MLPGSSSGGKDPAEIIKDSPKKWELILKRTKPVMEFLFKTTFRRYPKKLNVENKREIAKELLYPIKNIINTVEQSHWIQVLASKLKVEEKALIEALRRVKARELGEEILSTPKISKRSRIEELEEYVLGLVLKYSKHFNYFVKNFKENLFISSKIKNLFHALKSKKKLDSEQNYLKNYLIFKVEYCNLEDKDALSEIDCCIKEIKSNKIKKEMNELGLDIKEAEQRKDKTRLKKLTQKFSKLVEDLSKLNS